MGDVQGAEDEGVGLGRTKLWPISGPPTPAFRVHPNSTSPHPNPPFQGTQDPRIPLPEQRGTCWGHLPGKCTQMAQPPTCLATAPAWKKKRMQIHQASKPALRMEKVGLPELLGPL